MTDPLIMNRYIIVAFIFLIGCTSNTNESESRYSPEQSNSSPTSFIGNDYLIDDQHSYVGFKIKYFGYSPVRGRFNSFDGTLFYDENSPGDLSTTIYIDVSSINTGNERRDDDLRREGAWFDVANHPMAIFQSKKILTSEVGGFRLVGDLSIKGVTKEINIDFEPPTSISRDWAKNEQVDFAGSTIINRQDFGVFGGDFWSTIMEDGLTQLSDEVEIELNLHCRRPDYLARYEDADESDIGKQVLDFIKANGIEIGLARIDALHKQQSISSGKLSTIGYTLQEWGMLEEAKSVFNKKMELFEPSPIVYNQLGINQLLSDQKELAMYHFQEAKKLDSADSRATEYLRLMDQL